MDAKEMLKKIKEIFNSPVAAAEPVAPAAPSAPVMTKDGKSLVIDKMESGGVVMIDGMPAPAGSYELEDGSIITVSEGGIIAEVKPAMEQAAEPIAPAPVQPAPLAPPAPVTYGVAEFEALNTDYQSFKAQFDAYKIQVETRVNMAEQTISKQEQTITKLLELMSKIVDAPQADVPPNQKPVATFSKVEQKKKGFARYATAVEEIVNANKK
jgi:hypothetical protein